MIDENTAEVTESAVETTPAAPPEPVTEAAPKPQKAAPQTIASGNDGDDTPRPAPADWPENWREKIAGEDQEALKRLKRWTAPDGMFKSYRQLEKKLNSGTLKPVKPDTEDEAALAAWRKEVGVPEKPESYYEAIGDIDADSDHKPALDYMFGLMHKEGVPASEAAAIINGYYTLQRQAQTERLQADADFRSVAEDTLRAEYGPEYRGNMNVMAMLVQEFGNDDIQRKLFNARGPDGTLLGDDPEIIKFLVNIARDHYPDGDVALTPTGDGSSYVDTIDKEMQQLTAEMANTKNSDPLSYWHNESKQKRYQDLIRLKEKADARSKRRS